MHLTSYTDYTLRVLMYLGLRTDRRVTIGEICACYGISRNHVMKLVQDLSRRGIVETARGKSGGLKLALAPADIRVGDIVRATEPDFRIVECFGPGESQCRIGPGCVLAGALGEALAAFLEVLDGYTLADLIKPQRTLRHLLDLPAPAA
jgi:Rrf2 family transcriptional regulator, nitric oxide-sensitive transcriptional repressor